MNEEFIFVPFLSYLFKSAKMRDEELIATLKKEVLRLSQIEESCDESVLLYENTIKEMNKKMKYALKKEQERRKKAEFDVQRLKVCSILLFLTFLFNY